MLERPVEPEQLAVEFGEVPGKYLTLSYDQYRRLETNIIEQRAYVEKLLKTIEYYETALKPRENEYLK